MSSLYTRAIREAIIATLARVNGSAPYVNDLIVTSDQPRIWTGVFRSPPAAPKHLKPIIAIRCLGVDTSTDGPMTEFLHQGTWALDCWTAGDPKKPVNRLEHAEDLFEDLQHALHSNLGLIHSSTGLPGYGSRNLVDRLEVEATPFTEDLAQQSRNRQAYGRLLVGVTCFWRSSLPAQVVAP